MIKMLKNKLIAFLFFIILGFQLSADDISEYYAECREAYLAGTSPSSENDIASLLEISILVNDYEFACRLVTDYLENPASTYSENLFIMFIRFAYASNDKDLMDMILRRIPVPLTNDISKTHSVYIEACSSESGPEDKMAELDSLISGLPVKYRTFYESLINFSDYYLYFTPMSFVSEGHDEEGHSIDNNTASYAGDPAASSGNDSTAAETGSSDIDNTIQNSNTYIQIGSFAVEENAVELAKELNLRNFKASISQSSIQGQTYYRVIVLVEKGYTLEEYLDILYEHGYGGIRY